MIFFEIAVPNISITDYLNFLPLILSQDFNQLPPLSKGTAKIHIFWNLPNICIDFHKKTKTGASEIQTRLLC